ncbi:uncharacterized protein MELLADRAFT_59537 [Melampsora larici-populina 98AG31]|uniref:Uncharacterized protein n=1 Tax=Melampsora larici-populina (strain 98AG31 / pathotype 3-4-7) TaxID=747676 RepID=F4R7V3_MELLP|nr:uncharacterized protein MELLADRAFT_59537 [Melampsora larici-populina 98AG31]EGG11381.1 hypothetical protein MELLADRAFT_59537 [Melampsora larici-populina 98AG31]
MRASTNQVERSRGGLLNSPTCRRLMSLPIWGGRWSYFLVETDPGDELACIDAFQYDASRETRDLVLGRLLPTHQAVSDSLEDMLAILSVHVESFNTIKSCESDLVVMEHQMEDTMVSDWVRILNSVHSDAKAVLAAWNRQERDLIYEELMTMTELSPITRWYINQNIRAITKQEDRWRKGVTMNLSERLLFWFWNLFMLLGCIIPDTINFLVHALVAVMRSLPNRPQRLMMILSIVDFPFADERLARSCLVQHFIGLLISDIFGLKATFDENFRYTGFKNIKGLWWKGLLTVLWNLIAHNRKRLSDVFFKLSIKHQTVSSTTIETIALKFRRLRRCNSYSFSWFETYKQSHRFRMQISYHKQDQEDIVRALKWTGRFKYRVRSSEDLFGKFTIWIATIIIGCSICASTFPINAYAALTPLTYYSNIIVWMGLDVLNRSQSYLDVLRFFTINVGSMFPAITILIINLGWWIANRRALFTYLNRPFWISFGVMFVASLYAKFYGEMFKSFGLWIRKMFIKPSKPSTSINTIELKC